MISQPALLDLPKAHLHVLGFLIDQVPPAEFNWVLTGSGGLRLQGVDVPVHDLDIQTDEKALYIIEARLRGFVKVPIRLWESVDMRSLDGRAEIEGVEVELLANITHRQPDGTWCTFTDFSRVLWVRSQGLHIPVFPLVDELAAYEAMGRIEKAALIRKVMLADRE
jgi:hypothetical protein